jgi:hypothetical protein
VRRVAIHSVGLQPCIADRWGEYVLVSLVEPAFVEGLDHYNSAATLRLYREMLASSRGCLHL